MEQTTHPHPVVANATCKQTMQLPCPVESLLSSPSLYLNHSNIHHVYMCISQSYHPIVIKNDDPNATKAPRKRPQFRKTPFKVGSRCVLEDGRSGVVKWIGRIDGTGKRSNDPDIGLQLDDAGKLAFYLRMHSHCMHKRGF